MPTVILMNSQSVSQSVLKPGTHMP